MDATHTSPEPCRAHRISERPAVRALALADLPVLTRSTIPASPLAATMSSPPSGSRTSASATTASTTARKGLTARSRSAIPSVFPMPTSPRFHLTVECRSSTSTSRQTAPTAARTSCTAHRLRRACSKPANTSLSTTGRTPSATTTSSSASTTASAKTTRWAKAAMATSTSTAPISSTRPAPRAGHLQALASPRSCWEIQPITGGRFPMGTPGKPPRLASSATFRINGAPPPNSLSPTVSAGRFTRPSRSRRPVPAGCSTLKPALWISLVLGRSTTRSMSRTTSGSLRRASV